MTTTTQHHRLCAGAPYRTGTVDDRPDAPRGHRGPRHLGSAPAVLTVEETR